MDANIIIPAIATILAPILALVAKSYWDARHIVLVPASRRKAIEGLWQGTHEYISGAIIENSRKDLPMELELECRGKRVYGRARYQLSDGVTKTLKLSGAFYSDSILRLSYENEKNHIIHCGSFVLKINAEAQEAVGGITGYGTNPDEIFNATVQLRIV